MITFTFEDSDIDDPQSAQQSITVIIVEPENLDDSPTADSDVDMTES